MQDDAVNLQGIYASITKVLGIKQFLITYNSLSHWDFETYQVINNNKCKQVVHNYYYRMEIH